MDFGELSHLQNVGCSNPDCIKTGNGCLIPAISQGANEEGKDFSNRHLKQSRNVIAIRGLV